MKKRLTIELMLLDNYNQELKISQWPECDDIYYEHPDSDIEETHVLREEAIKAVNKFFEKEVKL